MSEVIEQNGLDKKADREKEADNSLVFSYLTLRNLIGLSGILLPFILVITTSRAANDRVVEPTISDYYYSSNGDLLVVALSILGVFLITYKGYTWQENALTTLAAIGGLGVAFSPTATQSANSLSIHTVKVSVPMVFGIERHFIFAGVFFIAIAIICLKYFPRTDKRNLRNEDGKKTQKAKRNIVFYICGWTIVWCVLLLGIYAVIKPVGALANLPVVFVLETIAIEAFGIAWITKGGTLWPDRENYIEKAFWKVKETLTN